MVKGMGLQRVALQYGCNGFRLLNKSIGQIYITESRKYSLGLFLSRP